MAGLISKFGFIFPFLTRRLIRKVTINWLIFVHDRAYW